MFVRRAKHCVCGLCVFSALQDCSNFYLDVAKDRWGQFWVTYAGDLRFFFYLCFWFYACFATARLDLNALWRLQCG